jgi:predicted TIM-barrel fold metal-dependent hydrolase
MSSNSAIEPDDHVVVVSVDGHVSPPLNELRTYCPAKHLAEFDQFAATAAQVFDILAPIRSTPDPILEYCRERLNGPEHADMDFRIREMDRDGVAAEITFHGSVSNDPMPFSFPFTSSGEIRDLLAAGDHDLIAVGQQMYNRWLADAVSVAPERFVGLAHLPMWDIDAAVAEVRLAGRLGLKGVNFPGPWPGEILPYDVAAWEPFWSAIEETGMVLCSHAGAARSLDPAGSMDLWYILVEAAGAPQRGALHRMIFSGVFEHHPGIKLMLVEQNGDWWTSTMRDFDTIHMSNYAKMKQYCPGRPSEYAESNVFIGASFMAPFEAARAVDEGYVESIAWGRDFPHPEGTWKPLPDDEVPMTRRQLRYVFSDVEPENVRLMAGQNALRACGLLDPEALAKVAQRIDAPTYTEMATPLENVPHDPSAPAPHGSYFAFRTVGPWA